MENATKSGVSISPLEKNSNTICAQITPPGRGAVAVISLQGENAESALDQHFRPAGKNAFSLTKNRKIVYGFWQSTGEDLVVSRRGDDHFEIHCHGGNSACSAILKSFADSNVRQVSLAEFAQTFENAWSVNTRLALTEATTARTAKILLDQVRILPDSIQQISALIESNQTNSAISAIQQMLRWSDFGIHLSRPRSIVLCGQPNVGKSSLANAIIGFQRAIVHDVAGTTRDVVSQLTAIDGWPVELKDTAGLRETTNTIEAIGIEKAKTQIDLADLRICVFDHREVWTQQDQRLLESIEPQLIVFNKTDLAIERQMQPDRPVGLETSAVTGQGIEKMIEQIGKLLVPELPDPGQAFPVTETQRRKLDDLVSRLQNPQQIGPDEIYDLSIAPG
jgi:tRNA modification GTPase